MNQQTQLHTGTTVSNGLARRMPATSALLVAYLGPDGGTATCSVWGRAATGAPLRKLWEAVLSGANDSADYLLEGEPWYELQGRISAISSATATIAAGV